MIASDGIQISNGTLLAVALGLFILCALVWLFNRRPRR